MARRGTAASGSGTAEDVGALLTHSGRLPASVAGFLLDKHCRLIAYRGALTDHAAALRGKRPRGWLANSIWYIVPGAYRPDRDDNSGGTGRQLPPSGTGNGSVNLLLQKACTSTTF